MFYLHLLYWCWWAKVKKHSTERPTSKRPAAIPLQSEAVSSASERRGQEFPSFLLKNHETQSFFPQSTDIQSFVFIRKTARTLTALLIG
jgi:hypothetical protein